MEGHGGAYAHFSRHHHWNFVCPMMGHLPQFEKQNVKFPSNAWGMNGLGIDRAEQQLQTTAIYKAFADLAVSTASTVT